MDMLRRKRHSLPDQAPARKHLPRLDTVTDSSLGTGSPTSSVDSFKGDFFHSVMPKAFRTLSRSSTPRSPQPDSASITFPPSSRKLLHKSHSRASSHPSGGRRSSTSSEGFSRISRASTSVSSTSTHSTDWRYQPIEGHVALDPDPQILRAKAGYLVLTSTYLIVLKSKADAIATFPQLFAGDAKPSATPAPEPLFTIPTQQIVAVFHAESSRPSFGIEVWWRSTFPALSFSHTQLFFSLPGDRRTQMRRILELVKSKTFDASDVSRVSLEVEQRIRRILREEEAAYPTSEPEIFPVAVRKSHRGDSSQKGDDRTKRGPDGPSTYFVVGINRCFLVDIEKNVNVQAAPLVARYQSFGLVTLESFHGEWTPHEERFVLKFRDPFSPVVTLELASRYYKQIILTLMKADKYLRPAWPSMWQTMEVFHVHTPELQHAVPGEDFGGLQKTLAAYTAAYRCPPVQWEINWETALAPEFRLLPSRTGRPYSALQLLAVLRALRYNDYFMSLSFAQVDFAGLRNRYDSTQKSNVAYLSRSGICLNNEEIRVVQQSSVLHQEFHALAFASETVRQLNLTNCIARHASRRAHANESVQFLTPVLNLLRSGLTRCNRLILRGCFLGAMDIEELVEAFTPRSTMPQGQYMSLERPAINLEVLDIAGCGLSETALRWIFEILPHTGPALQVLDVSHNVGRISAALFADFAESMADMRRLNVCGALMGSFNGPLLRYETLCRLQQLEVLDLSNFKLNEASQDHLSQYLHHLSTSQTAPDPAKSPIALRSIILNNCGIPGYGAARIFHALKGLYDVRLDLSGNPLEIGIDHLIQEIGLCWQGRFGLRLDMIEFREEANYIRLIKSLTINRYIESLSLVGTAPTPTEEATCSEQMCAALEQFFANNRSVRYLDLSGYNGKLDEGQLGKGIGRSLRGLAENKSITHLRMRNQNLNDDVGTLGSAISRNSSIRLLDCEENNFNLTSLRFMVRSLGENRSIVKFPISKQEQDRILERCTSDVPRPTIKPRKKVAEQQAVMVQNSIFMDEIRRSTSELQSHLDRNRAAIELASGLIMDTDGLTGIGSADGWPSLELKAAEGSTPTDTVEAMAQERRTVRSSSFGATAVLTTPYRIPQDDDALNTPASSTSPYSECPTTPAMDERGASSPALSTGSLDHNFETMWNSMKISSSVAEV